MATLYLAGGVGTSRDIFLAVPTPRALICTVHHIDLAPCIDVRRIGCTLDECSNCLQVCKLDDVVRVKRGSMQDMMHDNPSDFWEMARPSEP